MSVEQSNFYVDIALAAMQLAIKIENGEWDAPTKVANASKNSLVVETERMAGIGRMPYPKNKKIAKEYRYLRGWLDGLAATGIVAVTPPAERCRRFAILMLKMKDEDFLDWTHFRSKHYKPKENK